VPWYGRAWSTASAGPHAGNTSSARTGSSTSVTYATAAPFLARYGRRYDAREGVAWTAYRRQTCTPRHGCVTSWRQLYIDDSTAIRRKYDLVNAYGLRGAGIWALGYDGTRPELWNAIQAAFVTDSTPPAVGLLRLPARVVNPTFPIRWTASDDVGVTSSDVQVSIDGGPWRTWITRTQARSATWSGLDGHGYAFRVRARDAHGNVSRWNVSSTSRTPTSIRSGSFVVVRAAGLAVRSGPSTSATKLGTLRPGQVLAVTGSPRTTRGVTWVPVVGPIAEWMAIRPAFRGAWVAVRGPGRTYLTPAPAPNATRVDAWLADLGFGGAGRASLGPSAAAASRRTFSPNGDGSRDSLRIDWTNAVRLDGLVLRVFRSDGRRIGDVRLLQLAPGHHAFRWNGRVGAHRLAPGRYLVTLVGRRGRTSVFNPSGDFQPRALATTFVTIRSR
jgi:hypothetical protein